MAFHFVKSPTEANPGDAIEIRGSLWYLRIYQQPEIPLGSRMWER